MKASDVVRRALRMLRVQDSNEATEAEDMADALATLSAIFAEWRGADIMVPDFSVSSPADELTIEAADREAVAYQLALRLAPEYGVTISPEARSAGAEALSRFMQRYTQAGTSDLCELPCATGDYSPSLAQ